MAAMNSVLCPMSNFEKIICGGSVRAVDEAGTRAFRSPGLVDGGGDRIAIGPEDQASQKTAAVQSTETRPWRSVRSRAPRRSRAWRDYQDREGRLMKARGPRRPRGREARLQAEINLEESDRRLHVEDARPDAAGLPSPAHASTRGRAWVTHSFGGRGRIRSPRSCDSRV